MPYKSEQIKIEFSQFDKRIKLTDKQKEKIREEYATGLISQRNLAKKYKVSKKAIFNTIHPEKYQAQLEKYKLNQHSKQYYQKEKNKEYIKKHRRYKQELYINGEIINE